MNLFLLAVGCIMDIFSAIVIVVPIIIPIALSYGVDPIHLCVIFLVNLEIGYSTPPVGINLFISSLKFEKPVTLLYRASLPYLILLAGCFDGHYVSTVAEPVPGKMRHEWIFNAISALGTRFESST